MAEYTPDYIRQFVQENWQYYDAMDWKSPRAAINFYIANPDGFDDDMIAVDFRKRRDAAAAEKAAAEKAEYDRNPKSNMHPDTEAMFNQIKKLGSEGHSPDAIADMMGLISRSIPAIANMINWQGKSDRPIPPNPAVKKYAENMRPFPHTSPGRANRWHIPRKP